MGENGFEKIRKLSEMTTVRIGKGNPDWGADGNNIQYIFRLLVPIQILDNGRGAIYAINN